MSLIWADVPSGMNGLYENASQAVGIYAELADITIVDDPDPTITGDVFKVDQHSILDGTTNRYTFPAPTTTMGAAKRVRIGNLPNRNGVQNLSHFKTSTGTNVFRVYTNVSGDLVAVNAADVIVQTSASPFRMTPNTWHHIETKVSVNGATLTYEVRLDGFTVLSGSYASTITEIRSDTFYVSYYTPLDSTHDFYIKDIVYWTGTGSVNNDFFGTVSVTMQKPDSDVALAWGRSTTLLPANQIVNQTNRRGAFRATDPIGTSGVLRINNTYYALTTGSVDASSPAGTSANPWRVAVGTVDMLTAQNFFNAINATGTPGVDYSTALTRHPDVTGIGFDEFSGYFSVVFQANDLVSTYTVTSSVTNIGAGTMSTGYRRDIGYISAGTAEINTPTTVTLTDIPSDVTSVRGIISVIRLMKVDGGDAQVLVSLGDGVNWDDGAVWPTTTAPAYQVDVSELNPTTSTPWTPVQANAAQLKVDRKV